MPRRVIYRKKEIYRMRGVNWDWYYSHHNMASNLGTTLDREKIARVIARAIPPFKMQIDGMILKVTDSFVFFFVQ